MVRQNKAKEKKEALMKEKEAFMKELEFWKQRSFNLERENETRGEGRGGETGEERGEGGLD